METTITHLTKLVELAGSVKILKVNTCEVEAMQAMLGLGLYDVSLLDSHTYVLTKISQKSN